MDHEDRSDLTRIVDGENNRARSVIFLRWHLSCCFPVCQSPRQRFLRGRDGWKSAQRL